MVVVHNDSEQNKGLTVNLNKLYGPTVPDPNLTEEYFKKLQNSLPSAEELKEYQVLVVGTGPAWLFVKVVFFLHPFVKKVFMDAKDGVTEVFTASEIGFSSNKRKQK